MVVWENVRVVFRMFVMYSGRELVVGDEWIRIYVFLRN